MRKTAEAPGRRKLPLFSRAKVARRDREKPPGLRASRAALQGFTLIEVLVALVVTVSALVLIAQGFTTGARASSTSQNATRAALLGQQVMTDLEIGALPVDQNQSKKFDKDPDFSYEIRSEPYDEPGLVLITVIVKWNERNQDRTYLLTRLMLDGTATP